jgi:predicted dehydrogenase
MTNTSTWQSRIAATPYYAQQYLPEKKEYQDPGFWKRPDTVSTSIRTEKGALIDLRVDYVSHRPHNMNRYELQGTKASFYWTDGSDPMIWIEGRSEMNPKEHTAAQWDSLWKYRDEFEHPWWKRQRSEASKQGHGGGDHFVLQEFVAAIREGRDPIIDVYDAVSWSSIFPLSMLSVDRNNNSVVVPDFKNGNRSQYNER